MMSESEGVSVVGELCRLCGAQEARMLHINDTFCILGATSNVIHLLRSIAIFLKVQDDCEELMPKRLCLSCFNTAVDIQAFVDSGINFQKTTIRELFPDAKVEEKFDTPFVANSLTSSQNVAVPPFVERDTVTNELTGKQSQEGGSELAKQESINKEEHTDYWAVEQNINKENHSPEKCNIPQKTGDTSMCITESEQGIAQIPAEDLVKQIPQSNTEDQLPILVTPPDEMPQEGDHDSSELMKNEHTVPVDEISTKDIGHNYSTPDTVDPRPASQDISTDKSSTVESQNFGTSIEISVPRSRVKKCPTCKKTFTRQSHLKSHLASHSSARPYECPVCSMKFKYRRNLVEHSGIHHNHPSFICSRCGLTFKQKSNLLKHERTHHVKNNKPRYKCGLCGNEYSQSSHLKTHMNNIHGDNQGYQCSECKVVVLCKSSLRRHMSTVHAPSTKYTCAHCSKGFNNHQSYQGHVRRHTGERPYGCPHCTKTFTTTKALTRHIATHQASRTHKCPQCSKAFLELCDLKKHVRRHQQKQHQRVGSRENATLTTPQVHTGMSSINLVVLSDPLLFTQSHQLLDPPGSKLTQVMLQHEKLESCKDVNAEPVLEPSNLLEGSKTSVQEPTLELSGEGVLGSSSLLPPPPAVSLLVDTAALDPPVMAPNPTPLDPNQVLNPADIHVHEVVPDRSGQVALPSRESTECQPVSDGPTMVVLSSVHTPTEFMSVPGPENTSEATNTVIDGGRHQEGQRVLSHATW